MNRIFHEDVLDPNHFVITLELVPGTESKGRAVDLIKSIAKEAKEDGRVSAVSITDNPGGHPLLSPDVLGEEIVEMGMDVIIHFTCRDINRVGIESRALQLAHMGMKNIMALSGDFSGEGYGGQGAPVFDIDSVSLIAMISALSEREIGPYGPKEFFTGCAVSPFKTGEGECFAQYAKLQKKIRAGADFVITQLGYDARKYKELILFLKNMGITIPTLASLYHLTPNVARIMNSGSIPGVIVTDKLYKTIKNEWKDKISGRALAIERTAKLGAVLKGLGYNGIHIGGVHRSFATVGKILDKINDYEKNWPNFVEEFDYSPKNTFYLYEKAKSPELFGNKLSEKKAKTSFMDKALFQSMRAFHKAFFSFDNPIEPFYQKVCAWLDKRRGGRFFLRMTEDVIKEMLLSCRRCGDCGMQHVAFLCPESKCPKHMRNGACGGSSNGNCEVHPENTCAWVRAYNRLASINQSDKLSEEYVSPRMWELDHTSSWLNFHLKRDHQSKGVHLVNENKK